MVKNNFEKEIKIKCLEEDTTQAEIAEKAGSTKMMGLLTRPLYDFLKNLDTTLS